jgi:hypothetical protein
MHLLSQLVFVPQLTFFEKVIKPSASCRFW